MPVKPDIFLGGHAAFLVADARVLGDAYLRLHQIDAGDPIGHRVLDLNTGIDLDKINIAAVGALQKLGGAGIPVSGGARDFQSGLAQCLALVIVQIGRRRPLDHFLVAPLHGAVALEQMHHIAMMIGQDLHLHMAGIGHQFFQVHLAVTEGAFGFAPGRSHKIDQRVGRLDHAHAAAAAAPMWP